MIRCVIVDDEYHSRMNLRQMLGIFCPNVTIIGEADGARKGIEIIKNYHPDLVFLDIKMPDGTGFDILQEIDDVSFAVIFVTAFENYAIKAIKFNAIDYITKPIDSEELIEAVHKATTHLNGTANSVAIKQLLESINQPSKPHKKLILKTISTVYMVEIENIVRCESDRNYTMFFLNNGEMITISKSMRDFEELLAEYHFCRIHQSHLINLNYVKKFHSNDLVVVLTDNTSIPVSTRKKEELLKALKYL